MLRCTRINAFLSCTCSSTGKMIRELATKTLTSPSRTHLRTDATLARGIKNKREIHSEGLSNTITSFDALKLTYEEEDSEIEISGPFPLPLKPESRKTVSRTRLKEKHAVVQAHNIKPYVFFVHGDIYIRLKRLVSTHSSVLIYNVHHPTAVTPATLH